MTYRTIAAACAGELQVSRSRFLAELRRVETEEQARSVIAEVRAAHRDARHHCSAFVLGPDAQLQRSNDDGEPSGTAGTPILAALNGSQLSDVVAVVTRWFGGTLLGTGGLTRAYGGAVDAALRHARFVIREEREAVDLAVPHADAGRVEAELRARGVDVTGTDYAEVATLHLTTADPGDLDAHIAALTSGTAVGIRKGPRWHDVRS
ncbi:YigZ family protein [Flexivirga endophytica]|uniref:YigZ family protein n=1 Tax=Flexivirga endophytica TaxID=1849103 RepID=A0A916T8J7_9MICO|nr:YigZ family protein [Flexivirga endophytica]GGB35888.1 YigZ family protein [Flexivirga endophytica]GHB43644.1 YigZ family protein [Flexivirga endophytica]